MLFLFLLYRVRRRPKKRVIRMEREMFLKRCFYLRMTYLAFRYSQKVVSVSPANLILFYRLRTCTFARDFMLAHKRFADLCRPILVERESCSRGVTAHRT